MAKRNENGGAATADVPPTAKKRERKKAVRWPMQLQFRTDPASVWQDVGEAPADSFPDGFPDAEAALKFAKGSGTEGIYRAIRVGPQWSLKSKPTLVEE